jgi:acyl-coenzyme A thioesterase PaaI-like protein
MMALADVAMYVALLAAIGPVPLAVTINLNINFLRKPGRCDLTAEARLLKLGKRLASGEVTLRCEGEEARPSPTPPRPIRSRQPDASFLW